MVTRLCVTCKKEITDPNRKHYCSVECNPNYRGIRGVYIKCKHCGKEFERDTMDRMFCCFDCKLQYDKEHPLLGEQAHRWQGGSLTVTCDYCGKEYQVKKSDTKNRKNMFCSRECLGKWASEHKTGENANHWKGGGVKRICVICGAEFTITQYTAKTGKGGKCCSNECRHKLKSISMCGAGNPMYEDGSSKFPYCEKFNAEFKRRVRVFFDHKCILCGKTTEENKAVMAVHHIYANTQACCDTSARRFAPLCRSCHSTISNYQRYDKEKEEEFIATLNEIIDTKYNGKCYYTREEYHALKQ